MPDFLSVLNRNVFLWINNSLHCPLCDLTVGYATWLGDGVVIFPLMLAFLFLYDRSGFRRNFLMTLSVLLLGGAVLHGLKYLFQTPRPLLYFHEAVQSGRVIVHTMFQPLHNGSFPSGHTQSAFSLAHTVSWMLSQRGGNRPVRAGLYSTACLVGISRIYVGAHFPVDVIGGALVGLATSHLVIMLFSRTGSSRGAGAASQ